MDRKVCPTATISSTKKSRTIIIIYLLPVVLTVTAHTYLLPVIITITAHTVYITSRNI